MHPFSHSVSFADQLKFYKFYQHSTSPVHLPKMGYGLSIFLQFYTVLKAFKYKQKARKWQVALCIQKGLDKAIKWKLTSRQETDSSAHLDTRRKRQHVSSKSSVRSAQPQSASPLCPNTTRPCALFVLQWYMDNPLACLRKHVFTRALIDYLHLSQCQAVAIRSQLSVSVHVAWDALMSTSAVLGHMIMSIREI